jgi:glyoxylase-like metal-dependent hydrolase (beta-lactamase superfamily II)
VSRPLEHRRREPAPDVFRLILPLPFPGLDRVNAYLLRDQETTTLVDCGIYFPDADRDHGWDDLTAAFEGVGASPEDVSRLVVTHPHIDHYGMAGRFVRETGCELWMHEASDADLDLYGDPESTKARLREMLEDHGVRAHELDELTAYEDWRSFVSEVVAPTTALRGGEKLEAAGRIWEVVHTPGHSAAHVCLFDASERILISGDHLLPTITPHIDFKRGEGDPLGEFLDSLHKVEELDPALVLPGHGRPFEDGAERARVVARHHDRRLGAITQVIRNQPRTADQITDEVFGTELLHFQRRLALGEALAHLAYLRRRGEVERLRDDDGTFVYIKAKRSLLVEDE